MVSGATGGKVAYPKEPVAPLEHNITLAHNASREIVDATTRNSRESFACAETIVYLRHCVLNRVSTCSI